MEESQIQKEFLSNLAGEKSSVTIFLINGVKLQGEIKQHDNNVVILEYKGNTQLIFRHAISTIMPAATLNS